MKKLFVLLTILTAMFLVSCGPMDPLTILKANSQVKDFLDQYPDADVTVARLTATQSMLENGVVQELCAISLENKSHYKITMTDVTSGLEIYSYIDTQSQEIVCLKKVGRQSAPKQDYEDEGYDADKDYPEKDYDVDKPDFKEELENALDCEDTVELAGKAYEEQVLLEWSPYTCPGFEGYKVVWSNEVEWPKYPEQKYVSYITNRDKTAFNDQIRGEFNYYSITVLTYEGKVYSNPIKVIAEHFEGKEEPTCWDSDGSKNYYTTGKVIYDEVKYYDECEYNVLLEQYCTDDGTVAKQEYTCDYGCVEGACKEYSSQETIYLYTDQTTSVGEHVVELENVGSDGWTLISVDEFKGDPREGESEIIGCVKVTVLDTYYADMSTERKAKLLLALTDECLNQEPVTEDFLLGIGQEVIFNERTITLVNVGEDEVVVTVGDVTSDPIIVGQAEEINGILVEVLETHYAELKDERTAKILVS
ncbi:hypothetical protein GOV04_02835 [Candidatus Woesearchaeota archaeon]|nr:hypothetical protein [Candidatus Woesearchaeota archaeon]